MDEIIQKLVEFDRQCVEKVNAAKEKKEQAQANMTEKKVQIYNEYIESQKSEIEKHKQDLLNENENKAKEQEEEYLAMSNKMETLFKENKEQWVNEIVKRSIHK